MAKKKDVVFLKWSNFNSSLSDGFHNLLRDEAMVDVTLAAEGKYLKAHRVVLSVCSPYLKTLLEVSSCTHPIIFMTDVKYRVLSYMLQFMYNGGVGIEQQLIKPFMQLAGKLKVHGLFEPPVKGGPAKKQAKLQRDCQNEVKPVQPLMQAVEQPVSKPVPQPSVRSVPKQVLKPVPQPVVQPQPQLVAQRISQKVAQPILKPEPRPVPQRILKPVPKHILQQLLKPVPQTVVHQEPQLLVQPIPQAAPEPQLLVQPIPQAVPEQPIPQPVVPIVVPAEPQLEHQPEPQLEEQPEPLEPLPVPSLKKTKSTLLSKAQNQNKRTKSTTKRKKRSVQDLGASKKVKQDEVKESSDSCESDTSNALKESVIVKSREDYDFDNGNDGDEDKENDPILGVLVVENENASVQEVSSLPEGLQCDIRSYLQNFNLDDLEANGQGERGIEVENYLQNFIEGEVQDEDNILPDLVESSMKNVLESEIELENFLQSSTLQVLPSHAQSDELTDMNAYMQSFSQNSVYSSWEGDTKDSFLAYLECGASNILQNDIDNLSQNITRDDFEMGVDTEVVVDNEVQDALPSDEEKSLENDFDKPWRDDIINESEIGMQMEVVVENDAQKNLTGEDSTDSSDCSCDTETESSSEEESDSDWEAPVSSSSESDSTSDSRNVNKRVLRSSTKRGAIARSGEGGVSRRSSSNNLEEMDVKKKVIVQKNLPSCLESDVQNYLLSSSQDDLSHVQSDLQSDSHYATKSDALNFVKYDSQSELEGIEQRISNDLPDFLESDVQNVFPGDAEDVFKSGAPDVLEAESQYDLESLLLSGVQGDPQYSMESEIENYMQSIGLCDVENVLQSDVPKFSEQQQQQQQMEVVKEKDDNIIAVESDVGQEAIIYEDDVRFDQGVGEVEVESNEKRGAGVKGPRQGHLSSLIISRTPRAFVWDYFLKETHQAICLNCGKTFKGQRPNTICEQHLKRRHPEFYKILLEKKIKRAELHMNPMIMGLGIPSYDQD